MLLALMLCAFASSAVSQTYYKPGERTTTLVAGKRYFISAATFYGSARTNLLYNNNDGNLSYSNLSPAGFTDNAAYLFTVEKVGENNVYYIKNNQNKYLQSGNLASVESETGITVVPYNKVKGSVTCGNDVHACDENGNFVDYNNITDATPIVCVYESNEKGWRHINGLQIGKSTPFAFYEVEEAKLFPEVTTDETNPKWYTIKNVRAKKYVYYDGVGTAMKMSSMVDKAACLFYFTAGDKEGTYKIHNAVNSKLCEAPSTWSDNGIDWYIKVSGNTARPGVAISKEETLTDQSQQAWNDAEGLGTYLGWWGGNDAGSTWEITPYEFASELPTIQFSTEDNIVLHYIRSQRRDSYVNFDGHNVTFKEGAQGLSSYWYFVKDEEADVKEGFVACKIFNAAHATGVEDHNKGFMGTDQWPARTYYIGTQEYNRNGYVICRHDNLNSGWHDINGNHIEAYKLADDGSYWRIYPAGKTGAELKDEAIAAKANAEAEVAALESVDYYTYADEAIAAFKAVVNGVNTETLAGAVSGNIAINAAMAEMQATERIGAPVAGQYIQLKNKQYAKFLKANDDDLTSVADGNDPKTVWLVETGKEEGQVRLKNVVTGEYIGEIRESARVPMTTVDAEHNNFTWSNPTGVYAAFKETSSGNRGYGHINGSNVLVGWEAAANATQWALTQLTSEDGRQLLQAALDQMNIWVGTEPGQYTISDEAFTTLKANAQSLIDDESTDIPALCAAAQSLRNYDFATNGTMNLPKVGQYYLIECPLFYNVQGVKKALWSNGTQVRWKTLDENDKSFYWTVEATETGHVLKNYNDNKYVLGKANDQTSWTMEEAATGADYTIEAAGQGQVFIKIAGRHLHANGHSSGAGSGSDIVSWETNQYNTASAWQFVSADPDRHFAKLELDEYLAYFENAYYDAGGTGMWRDQKGVNNYTIGYDNDGWTLDQYYDNAKELLENPEATAEELKDKKSELVGVESWLEINQPEAGKFYRLRCVGGQKYVSADISEDRFEMQGQNYGNPAHMFMYDGEALLSYSQGLYMNHQKLDDVSAKSIVAFTEAANGAKGQYNIKIGERYIYGRGNTQNNHIDSGTGSPTNANEQGYNWWLEEVTTLPVTVGDRLHATFFAPVAVTIPNGIQAYTGEVNGEWLTLTEVEGTIPAGTPVVLIAQEAKTYGFAIEESEAAAFKSHLRGTTPTIVNGKKDAADKYYTLQSQPHGDGVAFRPYTGDNLGGFKAYLEIPAGTNAAALRIRFAGEEDATSIESVELGEELVIFDLAGRRVQKMEKGIYIVNGKKVVIK